MRVTISNIKSPFYKNINSGQSLISGGMCSQVDFHNQLTDKECDYAKLVSHTNFHQLVITAHYMNTENLSFREATIKYLKSFKP